MIKKIFLLVSFSFFIVTLNAQVCENLDAGADVQMLCTDTEVQLNAIVNNPDFKSSTDYIISSEPLCPPVTYDGSRTFIQTDDEWSDFVIDIPFSFCFFGNQYDQLLVSGNGIVTFDLTVIDAFSNWDTDPADLLGTNGQQNWQTNAIFGAYHDMNANIQPREDRISYKTEGVAPNRQFYINFDAFQFSCTTLLSKSQIILYESSNVIDVRIDEKPICNAWNEGLAVVGIQNKFGTRSQTGRENGQWTPAAGGELWRFVPDGEDLDYTLTWYDINDLNTPLNVNNIQDITVTPQVETTYVVQFEYIDECSDDLVFLQDTVTITPGFTPDLAEPVDLTECEDPIGSGTFDFNIDQTTLVLNGLDPTDFIISYHNSLVDANNNVNPIIILNPYTASNETIYIRFEDVNDPTCTTFREFNITALPVLDTTFTYPNTNYCSNDVNPLPIAVANVATFTINNGGVINADTGEIDLAASGLGDDNTGIFTITHDINMCSPPTSEFSITIELAIDSSFEFPAIACISEVPNPLAFNIATAGGTFTIDDNTVTINSTTGELDLTTVATNTIYTITYSFTGTCPSETSNTIEILADDTSFTYPNNNYCNDDGTNPTPTAIVAGGVYTINNGGVLIDPNTGEIDLATSGLGDDNSGNFTVTYTITACGTSTSLTITIEITNDASFDFPTEVCIDDVNPLAFNIATAGGTFTVNNGATISVIGELDLSTTTAGTSYTISYDFGGNCPSNSSQTITIIDEDDSSFDYAINLYCNDGTNPVAQNIATAGGTFTIDNGGVLIDSNTGEIDLVASALGTDGLGVFIVTYTTTEPCSTTTDFTITIEITNDANFDFPNEVCINDANPIAFNIATTGGTFTVNNGATISATGELDLSTTTTGTTYTITYSFDGNCPSSSSQDITIIDEDNSSFNYDPILYCNDGANPSAQNIATAGGTFTINNGGVLIDSNTGEIDLAASALGTDGLGVFIVTYTTAEPCSTATDFTITIEITNDASFEFPTEVCIDDTNPLAFNITTTGGIFTVNNGATISATGELDLSTTTAGTDYIITYSFGGNCPSSSSQTITIIDEDDSSFDYATNLYCNDDANPVAQNIATTGGTFIINNGGVLIDPNTGQIDLAASALGTDGLGIFIVTYTTAEPCSTATDFTITIEITNDANFEFPTEVCIDDANPIAFNIATAGGTFTIFPNDRVSIDANTGELDLNTAITGTTYTITYSLGGFCSSSSDQTINVVDEDNSSFNYDRNQYCNDDANPLPLNVATSGGDFTITNGGTINVSSGEIILATSLLGDDDSGVFVITYTTPEPCSTSTDFDITIILRANANFDYIDEICHADANPVATSFISGGTFTVDNAAVINTATGELDLSSTVENTTYTITYSFGGFCTSTEQNTILINESPVANVPADFILECDNGDGTANFDVSNIIDEISTTDTVTFYNSESDAIDDTNSLSLNPLVTNGLSVWVRVENASGCFVVQNVSQFLRVQQCFLVIPEIISPNSSDAFSDNRTFTISLNNGDPIETLYPNFELFIYNRYGNEVYVGNASEASWNGKIDNDGGELPVGTYFYGINLNDVNGLTYRGWVYLQR